MTMYNYTMCGLDYVYLRNGYRLHETAYGDGFSIERADDLHHAIAVHVMTSYARLRGQEVRFLRSLMDWSQADLARYLGLKRLTVARWESAPDTPIPGPADRGVRTAAAKRIGGKGALDLVCNLFPDIGDEEPEKLIMSYRPDNDAEDEAEPMLIPDTKRDKDGWHKDKAA